MNLTKQPLDQRTPTTLEVGLDDEALVLRAREGDSWAEDALFRRYVRSVTRMVARLLGAHEDVDDVVHDAFISAFAQLDRLRTPSIFKPWLMQIAVTHLRKKLRRRSLERSLGLYRGDVTVNLEQAAAATVSPEIRAELALIDKALRSVSANERIAWVLHEVEGYALDEVASACGCSLATTKRRIASVRARIETRVHPRLHAQGGDHV